MKRLLSSAEKTDLAFEEISMLKAINPNYLKVIRKDSKTISVFFYGYGQENEWFYSIHKDGTVNSAQFILEYSEQRDIPIIRFVDFLPFHPNIEEGKFEFDNIPMLQESKLQTQLHPSHLVAFIWGVLTYQIVDQNHLKNFKAQQWYLKNKKYFPLTNIALQISSTTTGFQVKPKNIVPPIHQNISDNNSISSFEKNLPVQHQKQVTAIASNRIQPPPLFKVKKIQKFIPNKKQFPLEESFQVYWNAPVIIFKQSVLNKILLHGSSDKNNEQFGILIGGVYENPSNNGKWLELIEMIPAERHKGSASYVEVSALEVAEMTRKSEALLDAYPNACRLGWYHTHPGHTIFMSPTDKSNHREVYRADWQIALVYDPRNNLFGFFSGVECTPVSKNNIFIIPDVPATNQIVSPTYQTAPRIIPRTPIPVPPKPVPAPNPGPLPRQNFSYFLKGALLAGMAGGLIYFGYWLGKTYAIKAIEDSQQSVIITSTPSLLIERQKWVYELQSEIVSNVLSQINQNDIEEVDQARLIGQLEIAISLDANSPIAKDAKNIISIISSSPSVITSVPVDASPTDTHQVIETPTISSTIVAEEEKETPTPLAPTSTP